MFPEKQHEFDLFNSVEGNKSTFQELCGDDSVNFNFFNEIDSNPQMNEQILNFFQENSCEKPLDQGIQEYSPCSSENEEMMAETPQKLDYHNFQKHLVITIRKNVQPLKMDSSFSDFEVENRIWEVFMTSTKMNKSLLSLVFGGKVQTKETIRKHGFMKIYQKYSHQSIRLAQENIKDIVFKSLQKLNIDDLVQERRIKNKWNFKSYLVEFMSGLKDGNFFKRVPSLKKKVLKPKY